MATTFLESLSEQLGEILSAVWLITLRKCLKKKIGASGFEPPTSWSRTRRSSQAEPRPEQIQFRLLQHPIATVWNVVPLSFGIAAAIRKDSRGHSVAASKGVTGWPPACNALGVSAASNNDPNRAL